MTMSQRHSQSGMFAFKKKDKYIWPSTFPRHQLNHHLFPIKFLKVIPIQSWGPSFNFSIWFLSLLGDDRPDLVEEAISWQKQHREKETIRLCLKHFRQHNYLEVFESLQKKTKIQLEHPLLTQVQELISDSAIFLTKIIVSSSILHLFWEGTTRELKSL